MRLGANTADSSLLAFADDGEPFRLAYRLCWDDRGFVRHADLQVTQGIAVRSLTLLADGQGRWHSGTQYLPQLDGCLDIDIWPTPLTNSFPLWRSALEIGQRREFRMAWVSAPDLTVEARAQAYARVEERLYRFESLDGSGFTAMLPVDNDGLVVDYPGLFARVGLGR